MRDPSPELPEGGHVSRRSRMAYAFGSSTPREFSFLQSVPHRFRVYDVRIRSPQHQGEPTLSDYMREARTDSVPRRPRDRSLDSHLSRIYVFGSSTPRAFAHLDKVEPRYRIYDVGLDGRGQNFEGKRSKTTSFSPADKTRTTVTRRTASNERPSARLVRSARTEAAAQPRGRSVPPRLPRPPKAKPPGESHTVKTVKKVTRTTVITNGNGPATAMTTVDNSLTNSGHDHIGIGGGGEGGGGSEVVEEVVTMTQSGGLESAAPESPPPKEPTPPPVEESAPSPPAEEAAPSPAAAPTPSPPPQESAETPEEAAPSSPPPPDDEGPPSPPPTLNDDPSNPDISSEPGATGVESSEALDLGVEPRREVSQWNDDGHECGPGGEVEEAMVVETTHSLGAAPPVADEQPEEPRMEEPPEEFARVEVAEDGAAEATPPSLTPADGSASPPPAASPPPESPTAEHHSPEPTPDPTEEPPRSPEPAESPEPAQVSHTEVEEVIEVVHSVPVAASPEPLATSAGEDGDESAPAEASLSPVQSPQQADSPQPPLESAEPPQEDMPHSPAAASPEPLHASGGKDGSDSVPAAASPSPPQADSPLPQSDSAEQPQEDIPHSPTAGSPEPMAVSAGEDGDETAAAAASPVKSPTQADSPQPLPESDSAEQPQENTPSSPAPASPEPTENEPDDTLVGDDRNAASLEDGPKDGSEPEEREPEEPDSEDVTTIEERVEVVETTTLGAAASPEPQEEESGEATILEKDASPEADDGESGGLGPGTPAHEKEAEEEDVKSQKSDGPEGDIEESFEKVEVQYDSFTPPTEDHQDVSPNAEGEKAEEETKSPSEAEAGSPEKKKGGFMSAMGAAFDKISDAVEDAAEAIQDRLAAPEIEVDPGTEAATEEDEKSDVQVVEAGGEGELKSEDGDAADAVEESFEIVHVGHTMAAPEVAADPDTTTDGQAENLEAPAEAAELAGDEEEKEVPQNDQEEGERVEASSEPQSQDEPQPPEAEEEHGEKVASEHGSEEESQPPALEEEPEAGGDASSERDSQDGSQLAGAEVDPAAQDDDTASVNSQIAVKDEEEDLEPLEDKHSAAQPDWADVGDIEVSVGETGAQEPHGAAEEGNGDGDPRGEESIDPETGETEKADDVEEMDQAGDVEEPCELKMVSPNTDEDKASPEPSPRGEVGMEDGEGSGDERSGGDKSEASDLGTGSPDGCDGGDEAPAAVLEVDVGARTHQVNGDDDDAGTEDSQGGSPRDVMERGQSALDRAYYDHNTVVTGEEDSGQLERTVIEENGNGAFTTRTTTRIITDNSSGPFTDEVLEVVTTKVTTTNGDGDAGSQSGSDVMMESPRPHHNFHA